MSLPPQMGNDEDNDPVMMTVRLRGGLLLTGTVTAFLNHQARVLDVIEEVYGNAPIEVPHAQWVEVVMHWFDLSEARKVRDAELDALEWRLTVQQDLATRFEGGS